MAPAQPLLWPLSIYSFYWGTMESFLLGAISLCSRSCTASWLKTWQSFVKSAAKPPWSFQAWIFFLQPPAFRKDVTLCTTLQNPQFKWDSIIEFELDFFRYGTVNTCLLQTNKHYSLKLLHRNYIQAPLDASWHQWCPILNVPLQIKCKDISPEW